MGNDFAIDTIFRSPFWRKYYTTIFEVCTNTHTCTRRTMCNLFRGWWFFTLKGKHVGPNFTDVYISYISHMRCVALYCATDENPLSRTESMGQHYTTSKKRVPGSSQPLGILLHSHTARHHSRRITHTLSALSTAAGLIPHINFIQPKINPAKWERSAN